MPLTSGTVICSIAAGVATGVTSGLTNLASTSTDNTVNYLQPLDYGYKLSVGDNIASITFSSGVTGRAPVAGDVAVVFVLSQNTPSSTPSGWTLIQADNVTVGHKSNTYGKVLDGSETVFNLSSLSGANALIFTCFDASTWEGAMNTVSASGLSTYSPPAVTSTVANTKMIQVCHFPGNVSLTDFQYTGTGWDVPVIAGSGTTTPGRALGFYDAPSAGASPTITWDAVGITTVYRTAGIVIKP